MSSAHVFGLWCTRAFLSVANSTFWSVPWQYFSNLSQFAETKEVTSHGNKICSSKSWILSGDHCYLTSTRQVNQSEAHDECQRNNAELASVFSEQENSLLAAHVRAYGNAWIGLQHLEGKYIFQEPCQSEHPTLSSSDKVDAQGNNRKSVRKL